MASKLEIIGQHLIERTLGRNQDFGGIYAEVTGAQGSGKTSVLLSFTNHTITRHPEEKIFWREQYDAPLQTFKLGMENINFLVMEGSGVVFRDRNNRLKEVDIGQKYFKSNEEIIGFKKEGKKSVPIYGLIPDFKDLWEKAMPGKANVVFFGDSYFWMDFIHYLRNVGEWVNIFIDELADISPAVCSGFLYKRVLKFASDMGAVRRCMMNAMTDTQTTQDVHWTVRKKVMMKLFLPGAISDKTSRVTQKAIDNLERDPVGGSSAYIDMGGIFGQVKFMDIYKPNHKYHIEAHVEQKENILESQQEMEEYV